MTRSGSFRVRISAASSTMSSRIAAAGLISLRTMFAAEKDEVVRTRYQEEIIIFEQAIDVQRAVDLYFKKYGENTVLLLT